MKKAFQKESYIEKVLRMSMDQAGFDYGELEFFEGYGNDERVYAWPTINIPGVSLQRFPFDEYHTSDDTPEIINNEYLLQSFQIIKNFIRLMETNYIPEYNNNLQPWLTRRRLYFDGENSPEEFRNFNNILLYNINGKNSVLDLANLIQTDSDRVFEYLEKFYKMDLIQKKEIQHDLNI